MGEALRQCDVCRAFNGAPHLPVTRTSSASPFDEELQVALLCRGDTIALHAMDTYSNYSLLEVLGALCGSRIAVLGSPRIIQMDSGDEWRNEIRTDFCTNRNIRLQFHGKGARPWLL